MNKETKIQQEIMLALSDAGCLVFRNNTGMAWMGRPIHKTGNQVTLADARRMPFGLCVGSSDLICVSPTVITQEMVGMTLGVFVAPEVKRPKKNLEKDQVIFRDAVNHHHGVCGVVRSPADALNLIKIS